MEFFVIDTNFFFNLQDNKDFGEKPEKVIENFTKKILPLKKTQKAQFFMPQRIADEFLSFFEGTPIFVKKFFSAVSIKTPDISSLSFDAQVFYMLVEEARFRSYRGLQIAQEEVVLCAEKFIDSKKMDKKTFQKTLGPNIKKLRERYRQATRYGFLDSQADLDLIVLAKELDATVITSDEGVLKWGRFFGIKELPVKLIKERLEDLSSSAQSPQA